MTAAAAGALCALGSAFTWTLLTLIVRALSPYFTTVTINVIRSAAGGLVLAAIVLAWSGSGGLGELTVEGWGYLTVSTVIAVGLGDTAFFESTKALGMGRATTIAMAYPLIAGALALVFLGEPITDRKSTRLNSSHQIISYAVFCLKKKRINKIE